MHHHIAVIHEHPAAFGSAFGSEGQSGILFFNAFAHIIDKGFELAVAIAGADDEEIGDNRLFTQIKQNNIFCLFVLDYIHDESSKF